MTTEKGNGDDNRRSPAGMTTKKQATTKNKQQQKNKQLQENKQRQGQLSLEHESCDCYWGGAGDWTSGCGGPRGGWVWVIADGSAGL